MHVHDFGEDETRRCLTIVSFAARNGSMDRSGHEYERKFRIVPQSSSVDNLSLNFLKLI